MKIYIPNSAFIGNIDSFLKGFDRSNPETLEITSNPKWISIHPVVLAMIGAIGLTLNHSQIKCQKIEAISKHYLERMGLFRMLNISSSIEVKEHEPAGRFIPLSQIKESKGLTEFIADMVPLLHLEPKHAEPLKYIVSELVRNVLEHANSSYGAILCAQYHKKSNMIRLGIADTGVGIKKTITASHQAATHLDAIRLALMPGITGRTRKEGGTEYNAGAGLFFIRSIAKANKNFFMIYSGNAMYKLLKNQHLNKGFKLNADPYLDRCSTGENFPYWNGTVVGIDITLDATEEFSALLDMIRETYIETIKERKKISYRRPRYI